MYKQDDEVPQSGLNQLVRFLVVELTHPGSNYRFDMNVTFTANYSFSRSRQDCHAPASALELA
jgi:hypothetical protein